MSDYFGFDCLDCVENVEYIGCSCGMCQFWCFVFIGDVGIGDGEIKFVLSVGLCECDQCCVLVVDVEYKWMCSCVFCVVSFYDCVELVFIVVN